MTTKTTLPTTTVSETQNSDASKLLSLLALATGAVAMPQTSNADIIFTDLSSAPVVVGFSSGANSQFVINNLPGGASMRFFRTVFTATMPLTMTTNAVSMRSNNSGLAYLRVKRSQNFLAVAGPGKVWDQLPGSSVMGALAAMTTAWGGRGPFDYNYSYMGFKFRDASNGGRDTYGWVGLSLSFTGLGPDVTIWGYAYDNLGNQIPMGATDPVPEPSSAALLALGALALGAKGVRSWRRHRVTASQT